MSERLTKIQNRVERASEVLSAVFGEDSIAVMVGEDGGAVVFPKGLSAYAALLINAREDLEHLLIENAALRTRVEQAERERGELALVLHSYRLHFRRVGCFTDAPRSGLEFWATHYAVSFFQQRIGQRNVL